jgi:hypothetical protein
MVSAYYLNSLMKEGLKIRKGQSEALNGKKTNNAMSKRKRTKGTTEKGTNNDLQKNVTLHRKLKN